jgi:tubulin polyglutamylase TTLL6/13
MNVACTEYEVIRRVAKRMMGYRLRVYQENHLGSIKNGEGGHKLSTDWDVTWHDGGITADFLSKLEPYQKVNHFPGMYQITRKNFMARNLMKMKRVAAEHFCFFPRTWNLPSEETDFRSQFLET